jgi:hypothetical protein
MTFLDPFTVFLPGVAPTARQQQEYHILVPGISSHFKKGHLHQGYLEGC